MRVAINKNGIGINVIKESCQFVINISVRIKNNEIMSPAISIIPAENTSVIASRSETTRVTIAPTGFLSK